MHNWIKTSGHSDSAFYKHEEDGLEVWFSIEIDHNKFMPPENYKAHLNFGGMMFEFHNRHYFTPLMEQEAEALRIRCIEYHKGEYVRAK